MKDPDTNMVFEIIAVCIEHESKSMFIEAMKSIPRHEKSIVGRILVGLCANTGWCPKLRPYIKALLEGETGHLVDDINFISPAGVTALHMAASSHDSEIVQMLLNHGASANVEALTPLPGYGDNYHDGYSAKSAGVLPLELALKWNCPFEVDQCHFTTNSGAFFVQLLASIFKDKGRKDIQLLAMNTKQLGRVIYRCVKEVEFGNLLMLLFVAREKVLSSNMLDGFEGEMTIREAIMIEIATLKDEELRGIGKLSEELELKQKKLMFEFLMLEVFEKAGDAIDEYVILNQGKVIEDQFAGLLRACGFNLNFDPTVDEKFSNYESLSSEDSKDDFNYHRDCHFEYDDTMSDWELVGDAEMHIYYNCVCYTSKAKSTFLSFLKTFPPNKISVINRIFVSIIDNISSRGYPPIYRDCILAMLNGEAGHDVDVNFLGPSGVTPLHVAASLYDVKTIRILLEHGANADIRAVDPDDDYFAQDGYRYSRVAGRLPTDMVIRWGKRRNEDPYSLTDDVEDDYFAQDGYRCSRVAGLLPIDLVIRWGKCRSEDPYSLTDDVEETLVKILAYFFKKRHRFWTTAILADNTKSIRQVIMDCIKDGDIFNLANFLLVTDKKVLFSKGYMKIHEFIMAEIKKIRDEELIGTDKKESCMVTLHNKKNKLAFMLLMLEVFAKAGDTFNRYLQSNRGNEVDTKDVASLLKGVGCNLKDRMKNIHAELQKSGDHKFQPMVTCMPFYSQQDSSINTKEESTFMGVQKQQRTSMSTYAPCSSAVSVSYPLCYGYGFKFPIAGKTQFGKAAKEVGRHGKQLASNKWRFPFVFTLSKVIRNI